MKLLRWRWQPVGLAPDVVLSLPDFDWPDDVAQAAERGERYDGWMRVAEVQAISQRIRARTDMAAFLAEPSRSEPSGSRPAEPGSAFEA